MLNLKGADVLYFIYKSFFQGANITFFPHLKSRVTSYEHFASGMLWALPFKRGDSVDAKVQNCDEKPHWKSNLNLFLYGFNLLQSLSILIKHIGGIEEVFLKLI
jgi:hypothetical protein